ncbi:metacaspase-2-like isoform X4 [Rhopalosiphum padi]|uniref:metacaspase-2-like isoform X4 n=1 Tax=Rhopalosiphum padi TaxID=40932 RepID=UPI00298ED095|nr:metacaspase-2-like isoform X4 [Rhopalosiphum padi]
MAEKMPNEIVIPSCSKYEVIDTKLNTEKKRELSISECEDECNDHTIETPTNRVTLCKDQIHQSNSVCRTSEPSLSDVIKHLTQQSDVIKHLTQQIDHIEKVASQNVIKKTRVNDVNYDEEFMYQPSNKIIKYDIEMSTDSFNLDENSIGSINKVNTTKHVSKKMKYKHKSYQKDVDIFKRNTKNLSNDEIKELLEISYNFDDDDNIHSKVQTIEDVSFSDEIENSLAELNNENEICLGITLNKNDYYEEESVDEVVKQTIEDIIVSLDSSNSFGVGFLNVTKNINDFENILEPVDDICINESLTCQEKISLISNSNQEYELTKTVYEMYEHNNNDFIDSENIPEHAVQLHMSIVLNETVLGDKKNSISAEDQRDFKNLITGDQYKSNMFYFGTENIRDVSFNTIHSLDCYEMNCSKNNNSIHSVETNTSFDEIENSLAELNNENEICLGITLNKNDYYEEESVDEVVKQTIEDIIVSLDSSNSFGVGFLNVTKNINDFKNILEPVDDICINESLTCQEKISLISNSNQEYELTKTVSEITDSENIPERAVQLHMSIVLNETVLDDKKNSISSEDQSLLLRNGCSESSIYQCEQFSNTEIEVNSGELPQTYEVNSGELPQTYEVNFDFRNDSIEIEDYFIDLTKCVNDEIIISDDDYTIIINEEMECKRLFENINSEIETSYEELTQFSVDNNKKIGIEKSIIQDYKLNEVNKHDDDRKNICISSETLNNQEKHNIDQSNIVDDLIDVNCQDYSQSTICDYDYYNKYYVDGETMLENGYGTSKINAENKNINILKGSIQNEDEMLSKMLNKEKDDLEMDKDCSDRITVSETCDDYFYENVSSVSTPFLNENDFLEVTREHGKRSNQEVKLSMSINYENNETIFNNKEIDERCERSLSFNSIDVKRGFESSNNDSENSDESLLFMPSGKDLKKYGIECEEHEKSISPSLNNLENNISDTKVVPQCKSPCLKINEVSKSINNFVSSSSTKDYEDNVKYFYDCDISSIENSDEEDNILLSFEKDTSIDNCIFVKNQDRLNATNKINNEQTLYDNDSKIQHLSSSSESCNNLSNVVETPVPFIYSPSHDHQYGQILSTSMAKKQILHDKPEVSILKNDIQCCAINPDADNKLEILNDSNLKITASNTIPSFNVSIDNINTIQSNLYADQGNFNEEQNLEDSNEKHNQNNKNKSISMHELTIKKSQKSFKNNESETISKFNCEEIAKINTVQSSSFDMDKSNLISEVNKKKYLEEIIKNEKLFNKFDEKLDMNESVISPYISQSLEKSTNSRSALAKKATADTNIHTMSEKALNIYLTQQTMTLDVLEVLHKSLDTCPSSGILMEDPEGLVVSLMPHQKHAIAWLSWRESQEPCGGILADDMGLGKTLTMISLVLKEKQDSLLSIVSIDNRSNDVIIGGTLIVCPASLLSQWENEFKTKLKPGLLKVAKFNSINRNIAAIELAKYDVVMTSYNIIMWDYKKKNDSSPLFFIKWRRIILDEAHQIRNKKTQTSFAVCKTKSIYRWAITGTPIHNKEADFFTLLKFIRCHPFDDWNVWKRWVGNNDDAGRHRLSLLVKTLMLRRTKQELSKYTTFKIPSKKVHEIEIELSKEERSAYEKVLQFSSNLFATYLYDKAAKEKVFDSNIKVQSKVQYFQEQSQDKDKIFKDHPELLMLFKKFKNIEEIQTYHILVLLLRLRQICCHPALIKGPINEGNINEDVESIPEDFNEVSECGLTNSDSFYNENTETVDCPNIIDLSRLMSHLTLNEEPDKKNPELNSDNNIFKKTWISTKIKVICDLVKKNILIGGTDKAIIVSEWPSFLYLIRKNLAHYKTEMFSGAIPIVKRNKIIREFNNPDGGPQILLLSLKAGGVGLNLMVANHLFLMDVHWNPQMEAQASDRVYRVGQKKTVNIYKFICSNTIEKRILDIQIKKLQIADNLFEGTSAITSKITLDDLKQIFQFQ